MVVSGSNPPQERVPLFTSRSQSESGVERRRQIVLVEDNAADVYLVRRALEEAAVDADLHVIRDGHAATKFIDQADADESAPCPDLLLLDLNLPKKTGEEVLRHLRNSARCRNARVLIVTSSDSARDRQATAALGIAGYFRKPSEYSEFMKVGPLVKELLSKSD